MSRHRKRFKILEFVLIMTLCIACFPIIDLLLPEEEPSTEIVVPETTVTDVIIPKPIEKYPIQADKKYVGVYIENPSDIDQFQGVPNIIGWFDTIDNPSTTKIDMCLDTHAYTAFISLEPADMVLSEISKGVYDDRIINYLSLLSQGDRIHTELFVRFAHEMEMRPKYGQSWYSWQGYDHESYVSAFRHVVTLGRTYAPNVKWVWSPNRADEYTIAYYPGDEYVDYVSLTLNNTLIEYPTFQQFYEEVGSKDYLEAYGKPIIFGEIAEHCPDDIQKNNYIASVFSYMKEYSNSIGFVFFNEDIEYLRQYKFSDDETQLNTFIQGAKEFLNNGA